MNINHISTNFDVVIGEPFRQEEVKKPAAGPTFADIFTQAVDNTAATDLADKSSGLELLTGDVDDLSSVMVDAAKAELALQLTVEIRDKILGAYDKIMMMSV